MLQDMILIGIILLPNGSFIIFQTNILHKSRAQADQPRAFVSQTSNKLRFVGRIGRKAREARQKAELKCHFCNLKYCIEEERTEHEKFWHSNKLKVH